MPENDKLLKIESNSKLQANWLDLAGGDCEKMTWYKISYMQRAYTHYI